MKRHLRRIKNLLKYKFYSFEISQFEIIRTILMPGETFQIKGKIRNTGLRIGTAYLTIKLANPYNHGEIIIDTNRDFDETSKQAMRYVDIGANSETEFCVIMQVGDFWTRGVLDIKLELWSPAKLFQESSTPSNTALFHQTKWKGGIEIINPSNIMTKVFISYSWHSKEHISWVNELSEELNKHKIETVLDQKDLYAGQEITLFMETNTIKIPICIAICSSSYTSKADNRTRGVGYEVSLLTNEILEGRRKALIIPILRDNPEKKKPRFFASILHIDMDNKFWKGESLAKLVSAIKKAASMEMPL